MLAAYDGSAGATDYGNGGIDHTHEQGAPEGSAVFVSNLQWWTTDAELEQLCAAYGRVLSIRFIDDKSCGKSRGMAIVEYAEAGAADACIAGLNGRDMNGRPCRVAHQQQRDRTGGGRAGGGTAAAGSTGAGRGAGAAGGRGRGAGGTQPGADVAMAGGMGMMGPGGMVMMPGIVAPGIMGMMPGMEMMQGMMMMPSMMPGMMPGMMTGMPGFKPPPPPGAPPPKKE
ncbi:hypothetical protein ABPG75_008747 [Micractinium tetrahymenae]